jgi:hypothetical protein
MKSRQTVHKKRKEGKRGEEGCSYWEGESRAGGGRGGRKKKRGARLVGRTTDGGEIQPALEEEQQLSRY